MKELITVILVAGVLAGQTVEPEMSADRPGFRNSTHLVGPGVMQFENGLNLVTGRALGLQPEVRFGVLRWLELRVLADNIVLRRAPGEPEAGISDLQVGVKFPIFERVKKTRVVGILKSTLPTGHPSQTTSGYEPGAELVWEHMMRESFSFSGTFNLTRRKEEEFVWQRATSLSANTNIGHGFRTFGELYVISPVELGAGNQWVIDGGVMRPIGRNFMVDASVGRSVHGPRDWFVALGFSIRTRTPGFGGRGGR